MIVSTFWTRRLFLNIGISIGNQYCLICRKMSRLTQYLQGYILPTISINNGSTLSISIIFPILVLLYETNIKCYRVLTFLSRFGVIVENATFPNWSNIGWKIYPILRQLRGYIMLRYFTPNSARDTLRTLWFGFWQTNYWAFAAAVYKNWRQP